MAVITDKGVEKTTLFEYQQLLNVAYQTAFGDGVKLNPQSPAGQQIGIDAVTYSRLDDAITNSIQQLNVLSAQGVQLDNFAATFSLPPRQATFSTTFVTIIGTPALIIPQGSLAETTNGDRFQAVQDIVIQADSTAIGQFIAVESGAVAILANTLTHIITPIVGWDTINNQQDGVIGDDRATDTEFRRQIFQRLGQNALGTIEAITAAVSEVQGVLEVIVFENDTGNLEVIQNVGLLPYSIAVIVQGGDATAVATAIKLKKSGGVNTKGEDPLLQTEVIFPSPTLPIYFYYVVFVVVAIVVTISQFVNVPSVVDDIKANILAYFNGTFDETIPAIGISDTLYKSRLYTPINEARGFDIVSLTQDIGQGDQEVITPNLNQKLITTAGDIEVVIQ